MPARRAALSELTDAEFVREVLKELDSRRTFSTVRDQLGTLLAMGPTLTAATEAGVGQLVEDALTSARILMAETNADPRAASVHRSGVISSSRGTWGRQQNRRCPCPSAR